jgi:hypothetical protein
LLEIPEVQGRFGERDEDDNSTKIITWDDFDRDVRLTGPLFWLAARLAKNRERLGLHYPSDSAASRHLAAGVWDALLHKKNGKYKRNKIECPTLLEVLDMARAEWRHTT